MIIALTSTTQSLGKSGSAPSFLVNVKYKSQDKEIKLLKKSIDNINIEELNTNKINSNNALLDLSNNIVMINNVVIFFFFLYFHLHPYYTIYIKHMQEVKAILNY